MSKKNRKGKERKYKIGPRRGGGNHKEASGSASISRKKIKGEDQARTWGEMKISLGPSVAGKDLKRSALVKRGGESGSAFNEL